MTGTEPFLEDITMYIPGKAKRITAAAAALSVFAAGSAVTYAETGSISDFIDESIASSVEWYEDEYNYNSYTPAEDRDMVDDLIDELFFANWDDLEPESDTGEKEELPSKFDLRDVDGVCYVPEIRSQNPFGTCWSFGSIAAAEISLAYQLGIDFNTASDFEKAAVDLSEKHLAWFSYTPLPENSPFYRSQSGEGYHYKTYDEGLDTDEETRIPYDFGGHSHYAAVLFSEGVGPILESEAPYINKDGKWSVTIYTITVTDDDWQETDYRYDSVAPDSESIKAYIENYAKDHPGIQDYDTEYHGQNGVYYKMTLERTADGDWSVDEKERFQSIFLKNSNILPSPAETRPGTSEYQYNEKATRAIKEELLAGRGVAINMYSDHSTPEYTDDFDNCFLSFYTADGGPAYFMEDAAVWAHYTYCTGYDKNDPYSENYCHYSNHVVCIVGYDDDFPKEYFSDPNGTIGGNGAWIARNSWGSKENSDPTAVYDWGNNGDGYFYLSYYDQSLSCAESYEFELFTPEDEGRSLELYDLFPDFEYQVSVSEKPTYMANVFTADNEEVIRDVGIMTAISGLTAKVSVYLLNDDFSSPTDGELVSQTEETFDYVGYHTTTLDKEVPVKEGQKYSVVLELLRSDGTYVFEINRTTNKTGHDEYEYYRREAYIEDYGSLEGYEDDSPLYGVMVVNEGESWVGAGDGTSTDWRDLTEVIKVFNKMDTDTWGGVYYDYDNFPIRSYPYTSILEIHNSVVNLKDVYNPGDVIEGVVTINNYDATDSFEDIEIKCSLMDLGEKGKIPLLESGEEVSIEYSYTVTEEDLGKGTLTSEMTVYIGGDQIHLNEKFSTPSFTVKVADKKPVVTEVTAADETEITAPDAPDTPDRPDTGGEGMPMLVFFAIGGGVLLIAAVIAVAVIAARKKKR